jgi:lysophospholipase L1-like esterase
VGAAKVLGRWATNLLLVVLSISLTLFLIEWSARTLPLKVPFSLFPSPANCMQRSPLLSLEFRPDCVGELSQTRLRTNSLGLRGPEVHANGTRLVLALGDSCTWGWRVDERDSYPAVLQELLNQRAGTEAYQVLNAGFPGHTSYQGLRYLRERGIKLKPWLVIVGYGFNDLTRSGNVPALIAQQQRFIPLLRLDDWFLYNSRMYRWLRWRTSSEANPSTVRARRVDPNAFMIYMTQIVDVAREHGAKVVLLNFLKPQSHAEPYRRALIELSQSQELPLIEYEGPRLDIVHPDAAGYRTLAGEIVDRLGKSVSVAGTLDH